MIVPRHYENLQVLNENTMPRRSYYVPASRPMGPLVRDREASDRFQLLNGTWQFRYFESPYDVPESLIDGVLPEAIDIPVPSVWQNLGFDSYQYTNIRYPIPLDPPFVPQENPCGAYVREFEYHEDPAAPRVHLNFEGADSCHANSISPSISWKARTGSPCSCSSGATAPTSRIRTSSG